MKRRDIIKELEKNGWQFTRHGGGHDIYIKGMETVSVPRHREVNEGTAKTIVKKARAT